MYTCSLFPVNDFQKYPLATGYKMAQPTLKIMIELLDFTNNVNERNTNKVTFLAFNKIVCMCVCMCVHVCVWRRNHE